MVTAKLYGRTGNRLFQKAAAIGYATTHNLNYIIDEEPAEVHMWPRPILIKEKSHSYQELQCKPEWRHRCILLDGYFQSARYFDHCREEVLKAFGYDWSLRKGWCSIHVRRGDYLLYPDKHPVVTMDYLVSATSRMEANHGVNRFLVFSDDIEWCRNSFTWLQKEIRSTSHWTFEYSEGRTEREDLELMSCCEHNIISNSTYSWWAAYLNQNPNKVVVSPSKDNWFGPSNNHLDTSDLIPESWIQIKY